VGDEEVPAIVPPVATMYVVFGLRLDEDACFSSLAGMGILAAFKATGGTEF
jgi:hypothetical protein